MSSPSSAPLSTSQVRVAIRTRPLSQSEQRKGGQKCLNISPNNRTISLITNDSKRNFTYDAVFGPDTSQSDLYRDISGPLLNSFFDGYNATILAYGQTGAGKTYTMGSEDQKDSDSELRGLLPRFMEDIFQSMGSNETDDKTSSDITVSVSFLEVYGDDVFDLLDENEERKSLAIREDKDGEIIVSGLNSITVPGPKEALNVLSQGSLNRTTASTLMNKTSSRSHAVFTLSMVKTESNPENSLEMAVCSRMTFVDLAGSERMKKTGAVGEKAKEGIKINEGLLALGNVINALADDARVTKGEKIFVPYRQSKLTRLLQGALGGNSQTLFLACISPSDTNANETLSTLQYANRARNIKNILKKNVDPTAIEIQRLHALNNVLQCELVKHVFDKDNTENQDTENLPRSKSYSYQDLLLRAEVQEFIQKLHEKAEEKCQERMSSGFKVRAANSNETTKKSDDHRTIESIKIAGKNCRKSGDNALFESAKNIKAEIVNKKQDGLNESFQDFNPDNDIALLDQLLQLQRKDQEFAENQRAELENIEKVDCELKEHESILLQLKGNIKTYHNMKEKYDGLMAEVSQLEKEKARLTDELEKAVKDPTKGCSNMMKKLGKVESSLVCARNEARQHEALCRKIDTETNKCKILEKKIIELKQGKIQLIRKQREAAIKHRQEMEIKSKEINSLRKKDRMSELKISRLEMDNKRHQETLERRKQSHDKLASKLTQTENRLKKHLIIQNQTLKKQNLKNSMTPKTLKFAPICEGLESTKILLDIAVYSRVKHYQLSDLYNVKMTEYGAMTQELIREIKSLKRLELSKKSETIAKEMNDIERRILKLESKLEVIGSECDDLCTKLSENNIDNDSGVRLILEESAQIDNNFFTETLSELSGPEARTLLLDFLNKLTKSECERVKLTEELKKKDAKIQNLFVEVDLHKKYDDLTCQFEMNSNEKNIQSQNDTFKSFLIGLQDEITKLNTSLQKNDSDMIKFNKEAEKIQKELNEYREMIQKLQDNMIEPKKRNAGNVLAEIGQNIEADKPQASEQTPKNDMSKEDTEHSVESKMEGNDMSSSCDNEDINNHFTPDELKPKPTLLLHRREKSKLKKNRFISKVKKSIMFFERKMKKKSRLQATNMVHD